MRWLKYLCAINPVTLTGSGILFVLILFVSDIPLFNLIELNKGKSG